MEPAKLRQLCYTICVNVHIHQICIRTSPSLPERGAHHHCLSYVNPTPLHPAPCPQGRTCNVSVYRSPLSTRHLLLVTFFWSGSISGYCKKNFNQEYCSSLFGDNCLEVDIIKNTPEEVELDLVSIYKKAEKGLSLKDLFPSGKLGCYPEVKRVKTF